MVTHEELGAAFQAQHLEVELDLATTFDAGMPAGAALERLEAEGFDHAPVTDGETVLGHVGREKLAAAPASVGVGELLEPWSDDAVVDGTTPIGDLLGRLAARPFLFVMENGGVTGFVTISDLNKQPARAYLYLVVAGLEIALADLVRWRYGTDQQRLFDLLGKRDQDAIKSRIGTDRDAGADSDLVSYMGFKNLLRIFEKDASLRSELGRYSQRSWRSATWPLSELRNDVMHPVSGFVRSPEDAAALAEHVADARALVEQAVSALRRRYSVSDPDE